MRRLSWHLRAITIHYWQSPSVESESKEILWMVVKIHTVRHWHSTSDSCHCFFHELLCLPLWRNRHHSKWNYYTELSFSLQRRTLSNSRKALTKLHVNNHFLGDDVDNQRESWSHIKASWLRDDLHSRVGGEMLVQGRVNDLWKLKNPDLEA